MSPAEAASRLKRLEERKAAIRDAATLADSAVRAMHNICPSWSVDELLCHPRDTIKLCRLVRKDTGREATDYEICKSLMNARKRGQIKPDRV